MAPERERAEVEVGEMALTPEKSGPYGEKCVMHVCAPFDATERELEFCCDEIGEEPMCAVCGRPVDVGGQVDHFFPYYTEMNRCKAHMRGA